MTLDLFDVVNVPDIRSPAPSAPGSESSRRAARAIDPHRPGQYRTVLLALALFADDAPVSREALSGITGIKESSLCGRLYELAPLWVEVVPDSCVARSGLTVDGYRLTKHGRGRVEAAA